MNQNTVSGNLDRIKRATDDMRLTTGTVGEDIETVAQAVSDLNDDNLAKDETIAELEQEIEGLQPSGTISVSSNGVTNVAGYQYADVNIPGPSGTLTITENGTYNIANYANVIINVEYLEEPEPSGLKLYDFQEGDSMPKKIYLKKNETYEDGVYTMIQFHTQFTDIPGTNYYWYYDGQLYISSPSQRAYFFINEWVGIKNANQMSEEEREMAYMDADMWARDNGYYFEYGYFSKDGKTYFSNHQTNFAASDFEESGDMSIIPSYALDFISVSDYDDDYILIDFTGCDEDFTIYRITDVPYNSQTHYPRKMFYIEN